MNSLARGTIVVAIALGAIAARAEDTDREKLEDAKKRQSVSSKVRRLLPLLQSKDESVKRDAAAAILEIPAKERRDTLADLTTNQPYVDRRNAARMMEGIKDEEGTKALIRVVLTDPIEEVRAAALETLRKNVEQPELVRAFYGAFTLKDPAARIRAAEAIGIIGEGFDGAVEVLIQELFITWGASQRVNVFFATQQAYVRDYDIEIAQQAIIADPVVGTVSAGVVLDTTMLRIQAKVIVIQRRVIGDALARLTGEDFGEDPKAWARWWEEHKDEFSRK